MRWGCSGEAEDAFVYASCGEGATSQGAFHEALNWASRIHAPVLFFVQDNKYAISVPVQDQTAGGTPYKLAAGYEGLKRMRVDGTDFFKVYAAAKAAARPPPRRARGRSASSPTSYASSPTPRRTTTPNTARPRS